MPVESPRPSTSCCTWVYEELVIVFNGLKPKKQLYVRLWRTDKVPTHEYDLTLGRLHPSVLPVSSMNQGPPLVYIDAHV